MLNFVLQELMYPKAIVLFMTAMLVLTWSSYFCYSLYKKHGASSLNSYLYYVTYTFGLFIWILSNYYFHTGLLPLLGEKTAVLMAIVANISALVAFASAYHFTAKLRTYYASKRVPVFQSIVAWSVFAFGLACNLLPDLTVQGASISGPSQFVLEFGPYTQPFFLGLTTLVVLTFINLLSLTASENRIQRTRINYMILGMAIFMCSTAVIQLGFTYFLNDFSLTWLPPALSVSEMLFMGYALLTSRFYSSRYILYIGLSFAVTLFVYFSAITLLPIFDDSHAFEVVTIVAIVGLSWSKLYRSLQRSISYIVYGDPVSPVEKIIKLENEFHHSPTQAMDKLARYLDVPENKLRLLDDFQGASFYRDYFETHTAPLVLDEVEEAMAKSGSSKLSQVRSAMKKTQSALVLPIYEGRNKLSHVLVSSEKDGGLNFSYEELEALQRVLSKVQAHINYERKVKQSQALANSIAHEMRNPLSQVQYEFEHLNLKIRHLPAHFELMTHVDNGKQAVLRGRQLIDIILREVNSASLDQEPALATSISACVRSAVENYGFDDEPTRRRVHLKLNQDFVAKVNETLFNFVIFNLLRNAIYYFDSYPDSHITIETVPGENDNRLVVTDTGPGIPADLLERIFDDFFSHRKSGGSGLGLGYCQRVMKAFGGTIHCRSEQGKFTAFTLSFPPTTQKPVVTPNKSTPATEPPNKVKPRDRQVVSSPTAPGAPVVLVVDDKEVQRALVKLYVEQLGYRVIMANNGRTALDIIHDNPVELVFMDIQMPVMDGFEASRRIKESYPSIPIIALSGEAESASVTKMAKLMDGRLTKPATKEALASVLNRFFNKEEVL